MCNLNGFLNVLLLFLILSQTRATLSKSDKKKKVLLETNDSNIFDIYDKSNINVQKDIVEKGLKYSDVLKEVKIFSNGSTLAYVTPWNNYGYDITKKFTSKFSLISPVWFAISYDGSNFEITGTRDIDVKWIMEMKSKNPKLKVIPRLLFENWNKESFSHVMGTEYIISHCIDTITKFISKYNFDGIVLEMWVQIGAYSKSNAYHFITHLGQDMKQKNLLFALVIPPAIYKNGGGLFDRNDFRELSNSVDYFSLMTYDYSQSPGPNAPIDWIQKCVEAIEPNTDKFRRSRILLGLNFYGYLYSIRESKAIIRHEFIDSLKSAKYVETIWHKDAKEHEFRIRNADGSIAYIWYPTKESVHLRIKLAESLGVGISIWEVGQGLDYFYNLL